MSETFQGSQDYVASEELMRAVNIAMVLQKPLLIKGEPGTGKTVLADKTKASLQQKGANLTDTFLEFNTTNGSFKNVGTAGGTESTLTLHFDTGTFPSFH